MHEAERRDWAYNRRYEPEKEYGWEIPIESIESSVPRRFTHEQCPATLIWDGKSQSHIDVIIVSTHGVCYDSDRLRSTACGVFFGEKHYLNTAFEIEAAGDCEQRSAELLAGIEALRRCVPVGKRGFSYPLSSSDPTAKPDRPRIVESPVASLNRSKRSRGQEGPDKPVLEDSNRQKRARLDEDGDGYIKKENEPPQLQRPHDSELEYEVKKDDEVLFPPPVKVKDEDGEKDTSSLSREPLHPPKHKLRRIILKTDSPYLVHSMTRYLFQWQVNGWTNLEGNPVRREALLRELERLVVELNALDVEVVFWLVDPLDNVAASALANEVLGHVSSPNIPPKYESD